MKNVYAVKLGRKGGMKRSAQKTLSSQKNGALGGRPPKQGILNWAPFFNALDESRRTKDLNPFKVILDKSRIDRERALILATAKLVSQELNVDLPIWAKEIIYLKQPYFVSGIENLKAFALLESPPEYKICNIFVLNNFLNRI